MKRLAILIAAMCLFCGYACATGVAYDCLTVNGHPGYLTAYEVSPDGIWDKVMILVTGFDTDNTSHPINDINTDWQPVIDQLQPSGWDIVIFDYVRGDIDIRQNADNLARFIEVLNTWAIPNYHLAIVGGSMGGIVTRCMFVQENSSMGAETYVSVDSPHYGVYLSAWIEGLAPFLVDAYAGHQMANGEPEYNELYGWMQSVEASPGFMTNIINPMSTLAIALSNGESEWDVDWDDLAIHTKYHPVCSYVYSDGLWSDYMPYHSVCMFNDTGTSSSTHFGYNSYHYNNTATSYFDAKQPNPQTEHSAPPFAVQQAIDFIVAHCTTPVPDTTAPVLTLVGNATMTLNAGAAYVEQGATVYDEGDPNCQVVIGGDVVNTAVAGTYVVTYNATDASGNVATPLTRTVTVVADTIAPVLTLIGPATMTVKLRSTYVEQGATVYDAGDPNCQVVIGGQTVNTRVLGTYVVTYDATDASGNHAIQLTRTVTVVRK